MPPVQQSPVVKGTADNLILTLPAAPDIGNTLTFQMWCEHHDTEVTWVPPGWTAATPISRDSDVSFSSAGEGIRLFYRVVQPGDTASWSLDALGGSGAYVAGFISEWAGVWTQAASDTDLDTADNGGGPGDTITVPFGTVTPTAGTPTLIVGGGIAGDGQLGSGTPFAPTIGGGGTLLGDSAGVVTNVTAWAYWEASNPVGSAVSLSWSNDHTGGIVHGTGGVVALFEGDVPPPPPPGPPAPVIRDADFNVLDTLEDVKEWSIRDELKDVGSGRIVINRYSEHATDAILKQGNWCQVVIPRISADPIFIWQLETGKTILLDASGGATWGGRGGLSLVARSVAWNESFVVPGPKDTVGVLVGPASTGGKAGQILKRWVDEATHANRGVGDFGVRLDTLDLMSHDFDYTNDSDGNAWVVTPSTADLAAGRTSSWSRT
jgi:hypothetical protein